MSLLDIGVFGADFMVIMTLISCILLMRVMPLKDSRLKFFALYIIVALVVGVVSYFTRRQGNNAYMAYLHLPLSFILSVLIFLPEKKNKLARTLSFAMIAVVLLLNVYEAFIIDGGTTMYNSISTTVSSITIGVLAIRSLIKLRFDSTVYDMTSQPMFWIGIAFAVMNIANIISDAFYRSFQNIEGDTLLKMVITSMAVSYLATFIYWIGILKIKRS